MGDEDDFVIENTDAGASTTIPMEAGQIKKGGYDNMIFMCLLSRDVATTLVVWGVVMVASYQCLNCTSPPSIETDKTHYVLLIP